MSIRNLAGRAKRHLVPSEHERMVRKWYSDGGDYALRFGYDLDQTSTVLDLGGYEGQWASDLFSRYRCPIYIFEPVSVFSKKISARFSRNDQIAVFSYALGGCSRTEEIHVSADGSSVFGRSGDKEQIEIIDVKDWMEKNLRIGQNIDLMKINIEGGEYELLERLIECNLLERIINIQVQFHDISKNSRLRMENITSALNLTHEATYQYKFVWENWRKRMPSQLELADRPIDYRPR